MSYGRKEREAAEAVGLEALSFVLADDALRDGFLGASGADPADIAAGARDPVFLGLVLDFLLQDEGALIAFAASLARPPETVPRARALLPGGDSPHWT